MIQRWKPVSAGVMEKTEKGNWVKFKDHESKISILKANITTLKFILKSLKPSDGECTITDCASSEMCCLKSGKLPLYINCTSYRSSLVK